MPVPLKRPLRVMQAVPITETDEETALLRYNVPLDRDTKSARWKRQAKGTVLIMCFGTLTFLMAINMSIITTTQTAIAMEFDAYDHVTWLTSSLMIAMSLINPLAGRLSIIFTPRVWLMFSAVLFAAGLLVQCLSKTLATFLAGRVITGIGAGGLFTVTTILVLELTDIKRRGFWIGLLNTGYTTGVSLGGVIGGKSLDTTWGWRGAFWFQIPLTVFVGAVAFVTLPRDEDEFKEDTYRRRLVVVLRQISDIDFLGILTLSPAILTLLLYFSSKHPSIYLLPGSGAFLLLFLMQEYRAGPSAIIPLSVLMSLPILLSCFSTLAIMITRWMVLFYTPIYAITILSWTPTQAGASLVPTSIGFASGGIGIGLLYMRKPRKSYFWACVVALTLFTLTITGYHFVHQTKTLWILTVLPVCNGLLTGAILNLTLAHLLTLTHDNPAHLPIATSLFNTFRGFAGSFGASIAGGKFMRTLEHELKKGIKDKSLVRRLLGSPVLVNQLTGEEKRVAVEAYGKGISRVFWMGVMIGTGATILLLGTYRRRRR